METEFNKAQSQYKFLTFDQTSFVTDDSTFMRLKIRMLKIELYTIAQMEVSMSSNNLIPCTVQIQSHIIGDWILKMHLVSSLQPLISTKTVCQEEKAGKKAYWNECSYNGEVQCNI